MRGEPANRGRAGVLPAPPKSVCLLRLSSLGDVTHVVPVVHALHETWPRTAITWIIGRHENALVGDLPGVEFLVFDKRGGWPAVRELRAQLRGRTFDVLLLMQLSLRANLLSTLVRARRRVGYDRGRAREMHRWFVNEPVPAPEAPAQHVLDSFRDFLVPLGLPRPAARWNLPIPEAARVWARDVTQDACRLFVICPASSHAGRNWHADGYAAVTDHASRQYGCAVVLAGGPAAAEVALARTIQAQAQTPVINLVGHAGLKEMLALLARATIVLAPDTGPMHMANAVGTPVIGLHAATDPRRSGPYSDRQFCVDRFAEAARRFRGCAPEQLRWGARIEEPGAMDLIGTADVIAVFDAFARSRGWRSQTSNTSCWRKAG